LNEHVLDHIREYGFRTIKMKLGANPPMEDVRTIIRLREAVGPAVQILLDPNGSWTLGTAMTVAKMLEPYNILYYEDPIRYDENNIRRLQQSTSTPICVSSDEPESLRRVLVTNTGDVVQCDLYSSGGIRGTHQWYSIARAFEKPTAMHSGREIGVAQIAKIHIVAAQPDIVYPMDAMYHQYVDDVLIGGKLKYENGCIDVPQTPGLGIELDDEKLAKLELTDQVHHFYDEFWAETKRNLGIGAPYFDNTVRRF
jgi:glucarate dehydratase